MEKVIDLFEDDDQPKLGQEDVFDTASPDTVKSYSAGIKKVPDKLAADLELSKHSGLPLDVVERNSEEVKSKLAYDPNTVDEFDEVPEAAEWVKNPNNIGLIHDTPGYISDVKQTMKGIYKGFGASLDQTDLINIRTPHLYGTAPSPEDEAKVQALREGMSQKLGTGGVISEALTETARSSIPMIETGYERLKGAGAGAAVGAGGALLLNFIPGVALLPEELVTVPAMAGRGAQIGAFAAGYKESFEQQASLIFDDLLQVKDENGKPLDENVARGAAIMAGIPSAGLDLVSFNKMFDKFPVPMVDKFLKVLSRDGIKKAMKLPGIKEAAGRIGKNFAEKAATEGFTEGLQQTVQIFSEEIAKQVDGGKYKDFNWEEAFKEVGQAARVGTLVGGTIATGGAAMEVNSLRNDMKRSPVEVSNHAQAINNQVRQDKLFQRSPDAYHDLVSQLTKDEKFYISPAAAAEAIGSLPPEQQQALFAAVPSLKLEMETAVATDTDIAMTKADYATYIAPYPQADLLVPHIKLDPADQSVAERQAMQELMKTQPNLLGDVKSDVQGDKAVSVKEMIPTMKRLVSKAMQAVGRQRTEAEGVSSLYAKTMARFAAPFGINAVERMNEGLLEFQAVDENGQPVMQKSNIGVLLDDLQKIKEGKPVPGLDEQGKGAVRVFADRLEKAGITPEKAREMGDRAVLDLLYPRDTGTFDAMQDGVESFLNQEVAAPAVEMTGENGQLSLNLSAATDTISGIKILKDQAAQGDKTAHVALNQMAENALKRLLSGLGSVKIKSDLNSGLYGGTLEPSLGVMVDFDEAERPAVLAALARFAQNFNQEQVHVRQSVTDDIGTEYGDGSYSTPLLRIQTGRTLTREEIEQLISETGLTGLTFGDQHLEAYYVRTAEQSLEQFERSADILAAKFAGDGGQVQYTASRLWAYGEGDGTIPYEQIAGDVRTETPGADANTLLIAERYKLGSVTPSIQGKKVLPEQAQLQRRIAQEYEALPDNDMGNPVVKRAYEELVKEIIEQYRILPLREIEAMVKRDADGKVIYDPETGDPVVEGEPYENSDQMRRDVSDLNRMKFFPTTKSTFGPAGVDFSGNPLLQETEFRDSKGYALLANDIFRIVHDYYAHTLSPTSFGPIGEEAAWKNHMATIKSPWAKWALTTETRGQNSWVNYRKEIYGKGVPLGDRGFARQKAALMPIEYTLTGDPAVDKDVAELMTALPADQHNGSLPENERVAWTTGEQQAERWSSALQREIKDIRVIGKDENTVSISVTDGRGRSINDFLAQNVKDGKFVERAIEDGDSYVQMPTQEAATIFGKTLADKITSMDFEAFKPLTEIPADAIQQPEPPDGGFMVTYPDGSQAQFSKDEFKGPERNLIIDEYNRLLKDKHTVISGDGLKVSSKGMREFYNKVMANTANGLIKKFDSKVEVTKIDTGRKEPTEQLSFPVTDKMRDSVMGEGFSLFQQERGSITFEDRLRKVVVAFTQRANMSTAVHEFSHFAVATHRDFMMLARERIKAGDDNPEIQRIVDDWEKLKKEVGADSDKFTVAQEEKLARLFEAYMREGKAPSEDLRRIFTRFRDWLVQIYRDVRTLLGDDELNDEVRGVFDRWLASEEEIAQVQNKNSSLAEIATNLGLPADIASRVADYVNSATMVAEESIYRELTAEQKRRETDAYKKEYEDVSKIVSDELKTRREYTLMDYMKENNLTFLDGLGMEGVPSDLLSDDENALIPDDLADMFGYGSGTEMVRALKNTPDFDRAVATETRKRLMTKYPDMIAQGRIQNKANTAIMNDKVVLALDLMIKELGKSVGSNSRVGMKQFAKMIAQQQVQNMKAADVGYAFRFEVSRDKSMREALKASRAGDHQAAMIHLQKAMINQTIFKNLEEFQDLKQKATELFSKVNRKDKDLAGGRDIDFLGAARYILSKFGMGKTDPSFDVNVWLADLQERDPDIAQDIVGLSMMVQTPPKPGEELTIAEFTDIFNAIENIYHVARTSKDIQIAGRKMRTEAAVAEVTQDIDIESVPLQSSTQLVGLNKFKQNLSTLKASLRRVELWAKAMDGKYNGAMWRNVYKPINDAVDSYQTERNKWMKRLRDTIKPYDKRLSERRKIATGMFKSDRFGRTTEIIFNDAMEMIGFMLHTGNESNLEKLLGGYGVERGLYEQQMRHLEKTGVIRKEDWELVQKLWDLAEDIKPISQKAHKSLYGFRFEEIEASPVQSTHGVFRGGYWPAIADSDQTTEAKTVEQMLESARHYMLATTGKGFTKGRVQQYKQPLKTDLRLASQHIDKVLRFAHLEPAIRDVARIINHRDFKAKIEAVDPSAHVEMLQPWLSRVALQTTAPMTVDRSSRMGAKIASHLSSAASLQLMGYNIVVAIQNIANVPAASALVGHRNFARAFMKQIISPINTHKEMVSSSKQMYDRLSINEVKVAQELEQISRRSGKIKKGADLTVRHSRIFMLAVDTALSGAIWTAAYDKSQREGMTHDESVSHADQIIRETMGAGNAKDISRLEASSPIVKALMPFYSFFGAQANLLTSEFGNIMRKHGWNGTPKMFMAYMSLIAAPAILGQFISDGLRNRLPDDEDDDGEVLDDWFAWAMKAQLKYMSAMVPFLGQGANAVINKFNDNPVDDRLSISPVVSAVETLIRGGYNVFSDADTDDSRLVMDVMQGVGFATNLPLGQVAKPFGFAADISEGESDPENVLDFIRGGITGSSEKK